MDIKRRPARRPRCATSGTRRTGDWGRKARRRVHALWTPPWNAAAYFSCPISSTTAANRSSTGGRLQQDDGGFRGQFSYVFTRSNVICTHRLTTWPGEGRKQTDVDLEIGGTAQGA